jgi:hypothetical protein
VSESAVLGEALLGAAVLGGGGGGESKPTPLPTPEHATSHEFTYKFTDIFTFQALAELPVKAVQFAFATNGSGAWQATLGVEDPKIRRSNWIEATATNKTALWIDIDGVLVYGGPVTGRKVQMGTGQVTLSGTDFCGYLAQRLQAQDYKEYTDPEGHTWAAAPGAPVPRIAYYLLKQALEKQYSLPIDVALSEATPDEDYWITFTAPKTQQQTLSSMMTQLVNLGYLVGIDYAPDVEYVAGSPTVAITLSYPRRGKTTPQATIDLSAATDMEWSEDGTQQADKVIEQTGGTGVTATEGEWGPAMSEDGYPLLERVISHSALSPTEATPDVLSAYVKGDLAIYSYPVLAPVIPLPMFGSPSIFDLLPIGNDVTLRIPTGAGDLPLNNPLFPNGLDYHFRAVKLECNVPTEGVPAMSVTLNIPPGTVPPLPPV